MSFSSAATTSAAMMPMSPPSALATSAGVGYGLFMALGAMFTMTLIMFIVYICLRLRQAPHCMGASPSLPPPPAAAAAQAHVEEPAWDRNRGLRLGLGLPQIPIPTHAHSETASGAHTGLPAHAIDAIPKFLYDPQNMAINVYKGKGKGGEMMGEEEDADDDGCRCCPICLGEYVVRVDVVRVMAQCGHMFHSQCLDEWLRRHPTCPVCRVSPLPTPLSQHTTLALAHSLSRSR